MQTVSELLSSSMEKEIKDTCCTSSSVAQETTEVAVQTQPVIANTMSVHSKGNSAQYLLYSYNY